MHEKTQVRPLLLEAVFHALYGIGTTFMLAPLFLYWWIHGNYERYIWIISGPAPYNKLGGGPYQLASYSGLFFGGVFLAIIAKTFQRRLL